MAGTARLMIEMRPDVSRAVAAQIVRRAHAAGLPSATVHRGSAARVRGGVIPAPRSVSLADEEGLTVVVTGGELQLTEFARTAANLIGGATCSLDIGGNVHALSPSSARL